MIRSMYAAIAGMRTHQQKLDVIGNNIANVNTYGYKSGRMTFQDSLYQTLQSATDGSDTRGGQNPNQIGYGSQVGTIDLLFTTGNFASTDNPYDCMIDGGGFFMTGNKNQLAAYDAETGAFTTTLPAIGDVDASVFQLSRLGNFNFGGDGFLVDGSGNCIYGYQVGTGWDANANPPVKSPDNTALLGPIHIPKDMLLTSLSIAADGTITGVYNGMNNSTAYPTGGGFGSDEPAKGTRLVLGKIALASVGNPNALEKTQGPYYKAGANVGSVTIEQPAEGGAGELVTNGLEMANVDLAREFSEMITAQRGFQANTRIITVSDEVLQELVNLKR